MKLQFKEFCYKNKFGGTGYCCQDNKKKDSIITPECTISKSLIGTVIDFWDDYEIGMRYICKLSNDDFENYLKNYSNENKVFVGEFDDGFKII